VNATHPTSAGSKPTVAARAGRTRSSSHLGSRVKRGAALSFGMLIALCAVIVWQRDTASLQALEQRMREGFAQPLQAEVDRLGRLPLTFPQHPGGPDTSRWARMYINSEDIRILRGAEGPVVLGSSPPVHRFLRSDGYLVAVYDKGRVRIQWMDTSEFERWVRHQYDWLQERREAIRQQTPVLP
jgi:hypothetical protein